MCEKVFVKEPAVLKYGDAEINFKSSQRWYLISMDGGYVELERDIIKIRMPKPDFYNMFDITKV